ncbi:MAG: GNAT family acetyltransferase [Gracilibacter sp. BRH_c7a]|nr:MAG: GNAT family acetyltransferase [Gracilibacter sp. BRH_c7a]
MKITVRECGMEDLIFLCEFSCKTFKDSFKHMNTPANMKVYLKQAYSIPKLHDELSNRNSDFYFLCIDEEISGYLKVNEDKAQTDIHDPQSLEIERIYLTKEFQGKGLGRILINKAIDIAKARNKIYVWLGVWEKNEKAIRFYKKNGFYIIGKHPFIVGNEEQTDFIMRKDLIDLNTL